MARLQLHMNL